MIVLSSTLATTDERITVARSLDEVLAMLDAQQAREVYVDGGKVIQTFLAAGLIDEISIGFAPVLIGAGLPLFGALPTDVHLELQASHASEGGMVHTTYRVVHPTKMQNG